MNIRRIIVYLLIPFFSLLMSACGSGGSSEAAVDPAVVPASSNWDTMVWDQGDWS